MTLDNSGNLLVGATSVTSSAKVLISASANTYNNLVIQDTGTTGGSYVVFTNSAGSVAGSISHATSTTVLYNTTSDARVKTNIVDAPSGNIDQIKVRSFDWIADNSHQTYGMVAQELLEVAPYAVHQPQDTNEMMAVDYSKLVPMMIKEIQDLKAELTQLKAKVGI
jgi:hypothetical protein